MSFKTIRESKNSREFFFESTVTQAVDLKYTSTVTLGDFNFPEIDWNTWAERKSEKISKHSFYGVYKRQTFVSAF